MNINQVVSKNISFQNYIVSLRKEFIHFKEHPLDLTLNVIFNMIERQNRMIIDIGNFCNKVVKCLTKNKGTNSKLSSSVNGLPQIQINNHTTKVNYVNSLNKNDSLYQLKDGIKQKQLSITANILDYMKYSTQRKKEIKQRRYSSTQNSFKKSYTKKNEISTEILLSEEKDKTKVNVNNKQLIQKLNPKHKSHSMDNLRGENYILDKALHLNKRTCSFSLDKKQNNNYLQFKGRFNIKPTQQTRELMKKSYSLLNEYNNNANRHGKKEELKRNNSITCK